MIIKFALISLLLATGLAEITPLPSTRTISQVLKITKDDNRHLEEQFNECSHFVDSVTTGLQNLFGGVSIFQCGCTDNGSGTYSINCQTIEDYSVCSCDDDSAYCVTVLDHANVTYDYEELAVDEEVCVTFMNSSTPNCSTPVSLVGQQRCGRLVSCGVGISDACSCEAKVNGQMCVSCDVCRQATLIDPYYCVAVNCTNIAGFENFSTDCRGYEHFFGFGSYSLGDPCTRFPSTDTPSSAAYPSTDVFIPASMSTIFIAISYILW